jgi:hypothetical protein
LGDHLGHLSDTSAVLLGIIDDVDEGLRVIASYAAIPVAQRASAPLDHQQCASIRQSLRTTLDLCHALSGRPDTLNRLDRSLLDDLVTRADELERRLSRVEPDHDPRAATSA